MSFVEYEVPNCLQNTTIANKYNHNKIVVFCKQFDILDIQQMTTPYSNLG